MGIELPSSLGTDPGQSIHMIIVLRRDGEIDPMMVLIAGIMILLGLAHVPIWYWSGQPWAGSLGIG